MGIVVEIIELDIVNESCIVVEVVITVNIPVGRGDQIIKVVTERISLFYVPHTIL